MRWAVFGAAALLSLGAFAAMAVQRRTLNPFGRPARLIRRLTDPALKPLERRILRSGGNPQSAPWWLVGIAIVGGILLVSALEWLLGQLLLLSVAAQGGGLVQVIVGWTIGLLQLALLVRVIGSWIGAGRFTPWMRPFWAATEWMLAPIRRLLPPLGGMIDFSPLIAWFVLGLLRPWLLRLVS